MGPGEAIAAVAGAAVAVAFLITVGTAFHRWVSYKQRKVEVEAEALKARFTDRGDYTEMLEERVRVLERIATDRGLDVAHRIEQLRDRQVAEKI